MSRNKEGGRKYISDTFERYITYVHCFNHQLHLIVVDVCESITEIKYLFTQINIINKFFKKLAVHNYFKDECIGGHLSIFLPIRWSRHYTKLSAIIKYEKEIRKTLHYLSRLKQRENMVTAIGLNAIFNKDLILTAALMFSILKVFKPVDKILQNIDSSMIDGINVVIVVMSSLKKMRSSEFLQTLIDKHETSGEQQL